MNLSVESQYTNSTLQFRFKFVPIKTKRYFKENYGEIIKGRKNS